MSEKLELQVVKKAFIVYHAGMLSENPHEGYRVDEIPPVLADTPNKAKREAKEPFNWDLNDERPKYTDLRVRRAPNADRVLYDGKEIPRWQAVSDVAEKERQDRRRASIEAYPDDTKFFVQNGFSGDMLILWGKDSNGYTTNVDNAHQFTKQEVLNSFVNTRIQDILWPVDKVLSKTVRVANSEHLRDFAPIN